MKTRLISMAGLLAGILAASPAMAQRYEDFPGFMHSSSGWSHMFFGGLMMVIFWGGLILLIVLLVRWLGGPGAPSTGAHQGAEQSALEILKKRYARGEIDKEEFQQRKRDLTE